METEIKPVERSDLADAFRVMRELRTDLDFAVFQERMARQGGHGYELYGAFGPSLVGLIGFRPVETMARGLHLHVDDLVVSAPYRGQGVGRALLQFAEKVARERALVAVFLDSRSEVIGFYEKLGYLPHTATLLRKRLVE